MTETLTSKINVEELMRRIREEVARRKALPDNLHTPMLSPNPGATIGGVAASLSLPRLPVTPALLEVKKRYVLADFLNFHDETFIRAVYRYVLGREPDADGLEHYLNGLRTGALSKVEILGRIRYSPEGRVRKVKIRGLILPLASRMTSKLPVFGYFWRWAKLLVRLPVMARNFERFEAQVTYQDELLRRQTNDIARRLEAMLREVVQGKADAEAVAELRGVVQGKADAEMVAELRKAVMTADETLQFKADREDFNNLGNYFADLIQTKVNIEVVSALHEAVQDKADADTVVALRKAVQGKADAEMVAELHEAVQGKADAEMVAELRKAVQGKADAEMVAELHEAVQSKADAEMVAELRKAVQSKADALADLQSQVEYFSKVGANVRALDHSLVDLKRNLLDQQRRMFFLLEEARKRLPEPISREQIENMVAEEDHLLDAFYVSFEDHFRGTREDIRQRVSVYLPIIRETNAGREGSPILDIGCGRGEWLELLKESGLTARGLDLNRVMVDQCRELDLDVVEAEVIEYMRGLKPNSLSAVTGFHIIEHIPFKRLVTLFDETLRVLQPGGVAIFETPNPENLIVGACNFYYDPTHQRPLPPEPMRYVAEARGFSRVEILRLHPCPETEKLHEGDAQVQQVINNLFFGPRDYALITYKA